MNPEKRSFVHRTDPQSKGLLKKLFGAFFSSSLNASRDSDHVYSKCVLYATDVDRGMMKERTIAMIEHELEHARDEVIDVTQELEEARAEVADCEKELKESKQTVLALEAELAVAKRIETEFEKVA